MERRRLKAEARKAAAASQAPPKHEEREHVTLEETPVPSSPRVVEEEQSLGSPRKRVQTDDAVVKTFCPPMGCPGE